MKMVYTAHGAIDALKRWDNGTILKVGVATMANGFYKKVTDYPNIPAGPGGRQPMPMTARQRRGFFAKLNAGEITVPYSRGSGTSETAGKRWTVVKSDNGYTRTVGNNASYAVYLYSPTKQARYMRDLGWKSIDKVWEENRDDILMNAYTAMREASRRPMRE